MPPKRPAAVVVLAVLQVVFAALGMCNTAFQVSGLDIQLASLTATPGQASEADLLAYWREHVPGERAVELAEAVSDAVLAVLMVAGAVGMLRLRAWGWYLTLAYAVLDILAIAAEAVFNFGARLPALTEFMRGIPPSPPGGPDAQTLALFAQLTHVGTFAVTALVVVYPILVLIIVTRRRVRAAFGGEPVPAESEDDRAPAPSEGIAGSDDRFQAGGT
jgi:hypothetical protein